MQDPSYGVAQPLQNHVHLISGHRFPVSPSLNLDQAYRHLAEAPTIVKQVAPMAWQYVSAPQDGTVWLEWISPRGGEYRFASDGYVWGDAEMSRREDFGGYTIEILSHSVGYRPQLEQMATHARTRYHLVAKHPNANAPPPDPNLWLVHYHHTDHNRVMPANAVPIYPMIRQQMGERRWLESQGRIERREFMLHDSGHWPQVTLPGQMPQHQGGHSGMNPMMAQQQMAQQRHPSYPWPPGAGQGPPAKRPRHSGPSGGPGSSEGVVDTSIEDEENVSLGDYFDHLSQRDISTARYMQHHRWMEEIFSSPYASSQIVPPDLGLGLMGALKGLTDGILEPPSVDEINSNAPKPPKAKEATRFTNLKKEQVDEFNTRVQKHLDEGQAEIERMKKEHAERMADFKKGSLLMQAERRLRNATWRDGEQVEAAYRLDGITNGERQRETVEDVVKEVEDALKVRITGYEDASLIEKGGYQEKQDQMTEDFFMNGQQDAQMQGMQQGSTTDHNGGENAMRDGSQNGLPAKPDTQAEALQQKVPQDVPQPSFQGDQQLSMSGHGSTDNAQFGEPEQNDLDQDDMFGDGGGMDMGDTSMMEGMNMDMDVDNGGIDTSNIDFLDDPSTAGVEDESAQQAEMSAPQPAPDAAATVQQPGNIEAAPPKAATIDQQQPRQASAASVNEPAAAMPTQPQEPRQPVTAATDTTNNLFDPSADTNDPSAADFPDTTFDGLDSIDNGAGDDDLGDVDFNMGMGESAFDGAMHGMEESSFTPGAGDEGNGQPQ